MSIQISQNNALGTLWEYNGPVLTTHVRLRGSGLDGSLGRGTLASPASLYGSGGSLNRGSATLATAIALRAFSPDFSGQFA